MISLMLSIKGIPYADEAIKRIRELMSDLTGMP